MTRWDYFHLERLEVNGEIILTGFTSDGSESFREPWTLENNAWSKTLDRLGAHGWELVCVSAADTYIFKRPKETNAQA